MGRFGFKFGSEHHLEMCVFVWLQPDNVELQSVDCDCFGCEFADFSMLWVSLLSHFMLESQVVVFICSDNGKLLLSFCQKVFYIFLLVTWIRFSPFLNI